jgi:ribosomal protein S18 acetylase RimI-like enzyme
MTELTVRDYRPADRDAVWDLHERALRDVGAFDPDLTHLDDDFRRIPEVYVDPGGAFLVGESAGDIVAMGAFRPLAAPKSEAGRALSYASVVDDPGSAAALKRMRVDPECYRQGFGSELLAALERRAREYGIETFVLDTTPGQTAARGFYESHGYRQVDRRDTDLGTVLLYRRHIGE